MTSISAQIAQVARHVWILDNDIVHMEDGTFTYTTVSEVTVIIQLIANLDFKDKILKSYLKVTSCVPFELWTVIGSKFMFHFHSITNTITDSNTEEMETKGN